jgi:hypothetical protein
MSRIDVAAQATSTRAPIAVTNRELLWSGGVIEISVPADAAERRYTEMEDDVHYLQFSRNIKGGVVNCFVHTNDTSFLGKKITAEIAVMRKTLVDGRTYLYIDLRPVERTTIITHRLAIVANEPGMWSGNDWVMFETPSPLRGAIILSAPDAKIVPNSPINQTRRVAKPPRETSASGDPQLDRLLADGWEIASDHGTAVVLSKMKKGERRTMTHHRPKKNGKSK